jgi:hypothetical protein
LSAMGCFLMLFSLYLTRYFTYQLMDTHILL